MPDRGSDLSLELDRVISCPYPASLVNLAKHLAAADTLDIRASLSDRSPCAVAKLASIVAAALPLWQYTIDILCFLCESLEFREELLVQNPDLLHALLAKANSSQPAFEEYLQLCITLLSYPLPPSIPLPQSAQNFFLRVFELATATDTPDENAFRSVYSMLNGACSGLLSLLSPNARQDIDEKLCHILSFYHAAEYSMLRLWCFGLTILAEHPEVLRAGTLPPTSRLTWQSKAGRKLFEKDVYKMLKLVYLNVMWATKGSVGVSDAEALEGIRIASRTFQCMDQQVRDEWARSDKNAPSMFTSLSSKIRRKDIDSTVQLEALCFYALTPGRSGLSPELVEKYVSALTTTISVVDTASFQEYLSLSLPMFAPLLQGPGIHHILLAILDSTVLSRSTLEMANVKVLCDALAEVVENCPQIRAQIMSAMSSHDLQSMVNNLLQASVGASEGSDQSCPTYAAMVRRNLISSAISMLLTTALSSTASDSPFLETIGIALLKKQQYLSAAPSQCTHAASSASISTVSLFQQECTPLSGVHLQDWKERLYSELKNQDHYQRDSIVRSVARICHDLETRCETVEAPLLQEKEKSMRLTEEIADLRKQVEALELKHWEDGEHSLALESEVERIEKEKDNVDAELAQLKEDFELANARAEEALRSARETHNDREVQLRSTILAHEEDAQAHKCKIEEAEQRITELYNRLQQEEHKLQQEKERACALFDEKNNLQSQLNDMTHELQSEQQTTSLQKDELSRLERELSAIQIQLQGTEVELSTVMERFSDLQVRHHELAHSSKEDLEKLEEQYENDMKNSAAKFKEQYNQMHSKYQDALQKGQKIDEAYQNAQNDIAQLRATIPPLEQKIEELTETCWEKDAEIDDLKAEIAEFEQMRNSMLAYMGVGPDVSTKSRANEIPHNRLIRSHRRKRSALQTQDLGPQAQAENQTVSNTALENIANASFVSSDAPPSPNGSTPKRAKSRAQTSFKIPTMRAPTLTKHTKLASKGASSPPSKRSALKALSPNRRHTTVGFAIPEEDGTPNCKQSLPMRKRRGSLEDGDDDFDMGSFLTGTPLISASGRVCEEQEESSITEL